MNPRTQRQRSWPAPRTWYAWLFGFGSLTVATLGLHAIRGNLQQAHVVLVYLLIVLAATAYGGRALGLVLAVAGFLAIDYFFQAPFDSLTVDNSLDWFVLVAFVSTSVIAASLLARAQAATERAHERTIEVTRLSRLGAELLGAGTAESALAAIAAKVREAASADSCVVFRVVASEPEAGLASAVVCGDDPGVELREAMLAAVRGGARAINADGSALIIPLHVHDRIVGVLAVASHTTLARDEASRRLLEALTYYTALAVERVTLVAQLEHTEALREGIRVREALLASVSHDLRTPLSTIKLLAQDSAASADPEVARLNAIVIEEQADRLSGIVTNVLDLARLRSSAFPVHPEVNAVEDLIGAVARQVSGILAQHRLERRIDQGDSVLLGTFDFVQSQRILTNLIENAVRHSPPDSPIVMHAWRDDDSLVFTVADHGSGVAPSERERIFEPFYRTPGAVDDGGGVGLGLYISRALAEAQSGTLTFVPSASDGSTFMLRLPAVDGTAVDLDAELLEERV